MLSQILGALSGGTIPHTRRLPANPVLLKGAPAPPTDSPAPPVPGEEQTLVCGHPESGRARSGAQAWSFIIFVSQICELLSECIKNQGGRSVSYFLNVLKVRRAWDACSTDWMCLFEFWIIPQCCPRINTPSHKAARFYLRWATLTSNFIITRHD